MQAKYKNTDYVMRLIMQIYFSAFIILVGYIAYGAYNKTIPLVGGEYFLIGMFSIIGCLLMCPIVFNMSFDKLPSIWNTNKIRTFYNFRWALFRYMYYITSCTVGLMLITFDLSIYSDAGGFIGVEYLEHIIMNMISFSRFVIYAYLIICVLIPVLADIVRPMTIKADDIDNEY